MFCPTSLVSGERRGFLLRALAITQQSPVTHTKGSAIGVETAQWILSYKAILLLYKLFSKRNPKCALAGTRKGVETDFRVEFSKETIAGYVGGGNGSHIIVRRLTQACSGLLNNQALLWHAHQ